jgi:hypothetical protein
MTAGFGYGKWPLSTVGGPFGNLLRLQLSPLDGKNKVRKA